MNPKNLAPLFIVTAFIHALALITRFDAVATLLPSWAPWVILFAQFPVFFVAAFFESKLDYGEVLASLPLWMRINSIPVKISFTLAFTYIAVVILQTWNYKIGPIDPNPPASWDVATRARYFAIMTIGMFFPNYLATTSLIIPPMRVFIRLYNRIPIFIGLLISLVVGTTAGVGAVIALQSKNTANAITALKSTQNLFTSNWIIVLVMTFGSILIPLVVGSMLSKKSIES